MNSCLYLCASIPIKEVLISLRTTSLIYLLVDLWLKINQLFIHTCIYCWQNSCLVVNSFGRFTYLEPDVGSILAL